MFRILRVVGQPLNQTRQMAMTTAGCECFEMCPSKALWQAMVWFHFCRRGVSMFDGQIPNVHCKPIAIDHPYIKRFLVFPFFFIQLNHKFWWWDPNSKHIFPYVFLCFFAVSFIPGLEMSGVCQPRPSWDGGLNTGIRGITTWQLTHISLPSKLLYWLPIYSI